MRIFYTRHDLRVASFILRQIYVVLFICLLRHIYVVLFTPTVYRQGFVDFGVRFIEHFVDFGVLFIEHFVDFSKIMSCIHIFLFFIIIMMTDDTLYSNINLSDLY